LAAATSRPKALRSVRSPVTDASSPFSVKPDPLTSPQLIAVAPVPDSWFSWSCPFVTEPLSCGPTRLALMLSPSRPNQLFPDAVSLNEAKPIEALVTVTPNPAVPIVTSWLLPESTVIEPASKVAFVNNYGVDVNN